MFTYVDNFLHICTITIDINQSDKDIPLLFKVVLVRFDCSEFLCLFLINFGLMIYRSVVRDMWI